jgi:hypothetical protein
MCWVADGLPSRASTVKFFRGGGSMRVPRVWRTSLATRQTETSAGLGPELPVTGRTPTAMARGGLDHECVIRLEFREVRKLADVGDDRLREKACQGFDELGREWRCVCVVDGRRRAAGRECVGGQLVVLPGDEDSERGRRGVYRTCRRVRSMVSNSSAAYLGVTQ